MVHEITESNTILYTKGDMYTFIKLNWMRTITTEEFLLDAMCMRTANGTEREILKIYMTDCLLELRVEKIRDILNE